MGTGLPPNSDVMRFIMVDLRMIIIKWNHVQRSQSSTHHPSDA